MQNAMKNFQDLFPNFQEGPVINIGELMNRASEEGCSWYHFGILIKEGELTIGEIGEGWAPVITLSDICLQSSEGQRMFGLHNHVIILLAEDRITFEIISMEEWCNAEETPQRTSLMLCN
jgi:hypothetical protein